MWKLSNGMQFCPKVNYDIYSFDFYEAHKCSVKKCGYYESIYICCHRILFDLRKCYEDICTGGRTKDMKNKISVRIAKDM